MPGAGGLSSSDQIFAAVGDGPRVGWGLAAWKDGILQEGVAASASRPESMESVTVGGARKSNSARPPSARRCSASALRKGSDRDQVFAIELDRVDWTRVRVYRIESGAMLVDEVVIHGLSAGERVAADGCAESVVDAITAADRHRASTRERQRLPR